MTECERYQASRGTWAAALAKKEEVTSRSDLNWVPFFFNVDAMRIIP